MLWHFSQRSIDDSKIILLFLELKIKSIHGPLDNIMYFYLCFRYVTYLFWIRYHNFFFSFDFEFILSVMHRLNTGIFRIFGLSIWKLSYTQIFFKFIEMKRSLKWNVNFIFNPGIQPIHTNLRSIFSSSKLQAIQRQLLRQSWCDSSISLQVSS